MHCRGTLLAALAWTTACGPRVIADDADSGETSQGGTSAPEDPSTPVTLSTTEGDDSGSSSGGTVDPAPAELCPASSSEGVGIDSRMRVAFASEATPVPIVPDPMHLTCNGLPIAGSTITGVGQLVFVPDEDLPPLSGCEIVLDADAVTLDDEPLAERSWMFYTGESRGMEFQFGEPAPITEASGYYFGRIEADGDDVVMAFVADNVMLAISNDRGDHFDVWNPQPDVFGGYPPALHLQNGVVHATWWVTSAEGGADCYYSRSEPGSGAMSPPILLDEPGPATFSMTPSVTSDGGDRVVVAWFDQCNSDPMCGVVSGIYVRTSDDGGLTFGEPVLAVDGFRTSPTTGPLLAWVDGGVAAAWNPEPFATQGLVLADGEAGFGIIGELDSAAYPTLERVDDGRAALWWHESVLGNGVVTLVSWNTRDGDGIEEPIVVAEALGDGDFGASVDAHGAAVVALIGEGATSGAVDRRLLLSEDAGQTFLAPQPIEFLLDADPQVVPSDWFYIPVAIADPDRVHFAWMRSTSQTSSELLYVHGDRIEPCGLLAQD